MALVHLLVLHGPHLDLLGNGLLLGQPRLDAVERAVEKAAAEANAGVRFAQGDTEGELVDELHRSRDWASHVLLNPGALAPTAHVLREALALCRLPYAELFAAALPDSAAHAQASVLRQRAVVQLRGEVPAVYLEAMQRLLGARRGPSPAAKGEKVAKEIGRGKPKGHASPPAAAAKTLGRRPAKPSATVPGASGNRLSREHVRAQIASRLAGRLTANQLASWGKEQWLWLERQGPAGDPEREKLAEALQALALSTTPGGRLSDGELIGWMAKLG